MVRAFPLFAQFSKIINWPPFILPPSFPLISFSSFYILSLGCFIQSLGLTPCQWLPFCKGSLWLACGEYSVGAKAETGKSIRSQLQQSQQKTTLRSSWPPYPKFQKPYFYHLPTFPNPLPSFTFLLNSCHYLTHCIFSH